MPVGSRKFISSRVRCSRAFGRSTPPAPDDLDRIISNTHRRGFIEEHRQSGRSSLGLKDSRLPIPILDEIVIAFAEKHTGFAAQLFCKSDRRRKIAECNIDQISRKKRQIRIEIVARLGDRIEQTRHW